MALSKEDHGDVKTHLGKALANKISKVTNDSKMSKSKLTPQEREDATTSKMMKRYSEKSRGARMSRSILG